MRAQAKPVYKIIVTALVLGLWAISQLTGCTGLKTTSDLYHERTQWTAQKRAQSDAKDIYICKQVTAQSKDIGLTVHKDCTKIITKTAPVCESDQGCYDLCRYQGESDKDCQGYGYKTWFEQAYKESLK